MTPQYYITICGIQFPAPMFESVIAYLELLGAVRIGDQSYHWHDDDRDIYFSLYNTETPEGKENFVRAQVNRIAFHSSKHPIEVYQEIMALERGGEIVLQAVEFDEEFGSVEDVLLNSLCPDKDSMIGATVTEYRQQQVKTSKALFDWNKVTADTECDNNVLPFGNITLRRWSESAVWSSYLKRMVVHVVGGVDSSFDVTAEMIYDAITMEVLLEKP